MILHKYVILHIYIFIYTHDFPITNPHVVGDIHRISPNIFSSYAQEHLQETIVLHMKNRDSTIYVPFKPIPLLHLSRCALWSKHGIWGYGEP